MCLNKMKRALLDAVFTRVKTGGVNFYPEAREAVKEAYEFIKNADIKSAVRAVRRTELSYEIYKEAKQYASQSK